MCKFFSLHAWHWVERISRITAFNPVRSPETVLFLSHYTNGTVQGKEVQATYTGPIKSGSQGLRSSTVTTELGILTTRPEDIWELVVSPC